MTRRPYGDHSILLSSGDPPSAAVAAQLRRIAAGVGPEAGECVYGYVTLVATWDPLGACEAPRVPTLDQAVGPQSVAPSRRVTIPVLYGGAAGPDLEAVAAEVGLTAREVVARHASRVYHVYFLGFVPGFAYLGDVPPAIAAPRLATPRNVVPAGSVGVAGRQTGVYPRATPGGWRLLGRTPLRVYDPGRGEPALLHPGDEVVFTPVEAGGGQPGAEEAQAPELADPAGSPVLQVVQPGLLTTVQDLGRWGHQADGVSPSGAADALAARLANRVVGNPDGAAVLEITALGPTVTALADIAVAVVGADLGAAVDGTPFTPGVAVHLRRGAGITFAGPRAGCRAYLAVGGGFAVRPVLGSRSSDPLGGLGPPPLRAADVLRAYPPAAPPTAVAGRRLRAGVYAPPPPGEPLQVGVLPGPQEDWFEPEWWAPERAASIASDRVGLRLEGEAVRRHAARSATELLSEPNVLGAVQVPPDGQPVVLLAGRPTVGGYPKPGVVCTVDAWRLAQVMPGAGRVRLRRVGLSWARARLAEIRALLADRGLVMGG